jgi:cytochrome c oxidase subunit 4
MANKHEHHVTPTGVYIGVFLGLMVLTAVTVGAAMIDLGALNTPIALAIAGTKATLVMYFFMELRHAPPLTRLVALTGIMFLSILLILTFGDYFGRGMVRVPTHW